MSYSFDKDNHVHQYNGRTMPGVTTVLKTISPVSFDEDGNVSSKTDMLMAWAVKQVAEKFAERAPEYVEAKTKKAKEEIVKECKRAYKQARDKAGAHGTDVHGILDSILCGDSPEVPEEVKAQVDYALEAIKPYTMIANEQSVWSVDKWYAGIFDLLLERDGKKYVADFKTSKSWHPEHFAQMAAYDMALTEMGKVGSGEIAGYIIIHIPAAGNFATVHNDEWGISTKSAKGVFLAALKIYRETHGWAEMGRAKWAK
jgi:hypothetical protein